MHIRIGVSSLLLDLQLCPGVSNGPGTKWGLRERALGEGSPEPVVETAGVREHCPRL